MIGQTLARKSWTQPGTLAGLLTVIAVALTSALFTSMDDTQQILFGFLHFAFAVFSLIISNKFLQSLSLRPQDTRNNSGMVLLTARVFCAINALVAIGYILIGLFILMALAALIIAFS